MPLTSLWHDRHPRPPGTDTEPTEVTGDFDTVVIGAGITGLTAALLLARSGQSVAVIEARHVGAGTTGGSTAKVSVLQGTQLSTIRRLHSEELLGQYVQANLEGQAWLSRFCADHDVSVQRRAAYTFATSSHGSNSARAELAAARAAGLPATWQDELDLPFETRGGVRLDDQLQVDPLELLEALSLQGAAHGVRILEGARVRRVTGRGPVRVETDTGGANAQWVIVATNLPFLDRGGYFARATPSRSYGLAYRTPQQAVDGMYLSAEVPSRSLRDVPDEDGPLLLVGGNGHKPGAPLSEQSKLDELRQWTAALYPDAQETHAWSAQDYAPHHCLPFAGPVLPGADQVLVAGGFSKWGLTNGPAAALALAGRILGGHQEWATVFEPWRSRELRGLAKAARANGEVALEMTWGWLRPATHPGTGPPSTEGGGTVRMDRLGLPTAVARVDGVERRLSGVCTHLGGIVRFNDAERSWDCPLHGSRFGHDGEVLEGPATCGLRRRD